MPFSYHRGLVSGLLKKFREGLLVAVEGGLVVEETVGETMLSCYHAGS